MTAHSRRGKVPARWAALAIGLLAAALSLTAVPADALVRPTDPSQSFGEPRYTVEVLGFTALDESGADWSGSDEVFGLFSSTRGYSVRTKKQGDVDSGNSRAFASQERCLTRQRVLSGSPDRGWLIAPDTRWDCDPRGAPAPIGLRLELFEDDGCNPFFPSCFNTYSPPVRDPADDLIGRVERTFDASELSRLRRVGDAFTTSFVLGGPCGYQPPNHVCGTGWLTPTGPEYRLFIIVRRVEDARPVVTR